MVGNSWCGRTVQPDTRGFTHCTRVVPLVGTNWSQPGCKSVFLFTKKKRVSQSSSSTTGEMHRLAKENTSGDPIHFI